MRSPTKHQANPVSQSSCKFGYQHRWFLPIYRNGQLAAPNEEWTECDKCGRVEDENGRPVIELTFVRITR